MKGSSSVRRLRLRSFCPVIGSFLVFCNVRLQIAEEWLHSGCHVVLPFALLDACLPLRVADRKMQWLHQGLLLRGRAACVVLLLFAAINW
jgi:hypothetical protein